MSTPNTTPPAALLLRLANPAQPAPPLLDALDLHGRLRTAAEAAGGQKPFALNHGLAPQHVNDVLATRREPSPRILAALGLRQVTRYALTRIAAEG